MRASAGLSGLVRITYFRHAYLQIASQFLDMCVRRPFRPCPHRKKHSIQICKQSVAVFFSMCRIYYIYTFTASSACDISAIRSSASSSPQEYLMRSGYTPHASSSASFICLWVALAGCRQQVRASAT